MAKILSLLILIGCTFLIAQQDNLLSLKKSNLGVYINNDSDGLFLDGYAHYSFSSGFFSEISFDQYRLNEDKNTFYNSTLGLLKNVSTKRSFGLGYSNYFNNLRSIEHELFFGSNFTFISSILYYDLTNNLFTYQGILDLDSFFKITPIEINISFIHDNSSTDLICRLSKSINNNILIGYILSRENSEYLKEMTYTKNGKTGIYSKEMQEMSFFHEIFMGFNF